MATTYLDAEGAVMAWINSQTATLVGTGMPVPKGAHVNRMRGAASVAYILLAQLNAGSAFGEENGDMRARISGQVYARTKEDAAAAAAAYANALEDLSEGGPPRAVPGAEILVCDNITGPAWQPDIDEPRYVVDADFYLRPA